MGCAALIGNHPIRQPNRALDEVVLRITEQASDVRKRIRAHVAAERATATLFLSFCSHSRISMRLCWVINLSRGVVHLMQPVRLGDTWMPYARPLRDIDEHELPITAAILPRYDIAADLGDTAIKLFLPQGCRKK